MAGFTEMAEAWGARVAAAGRGAAPKPRLGLAVPWGPALQDDGMAEARILDRRARRWPLSPLLVLSVVVAPLIAAAFLAAFVGWGARRVDDSAMERERNLLSGALVDRLAAFGKEQESVTIWDDAVEHVRALDQRWMADNIAEWLHTFYAHDQTIVLDPRDRIARATSAGGVFPARLLEVEMAELAPLVGALRREIREPLSGGGPSAREIVLLAGRPAMVSIGPILPDSVGAALAPSEMALHIAIQFIDGPLLARIGARYAIANVRFEPGPAAGADPGLALVAGRGGEIGRIVWDSERPGSRLIGEMAPGLALFAAVLVLLIRWLLSRLRRAALRLTSTEAEAIHLAYHDPLTGLPNRALMDRRLERDLARPAGAGGMLALHYIDLDRFKNVNDTLGHPAGDELIRQVAGRLIRIADPRDLVARLGGDEFAVIQSDIDAGGGAERLARDILAALKLPFTLEGHQAFIDGSVGIAIAGAGADTRTELQRRADIALYEVKAHGKGHHCFFEPRLEEAVLYKRVIETDLRATLSGDAEGLDVVYQPLFDADGRTLRGAEALVRWDHPSHGTLSPAVFIPIAEERGLIQELGLWVMREALRTAEQVGLPSIAVNVSAIQFRDEGFEDRILDLLAEFRVSPERLQIEITEGLLLDSGDNIGRALTKLRFAGARISLDDFGTGYSSLNYLRRYKVDKIKIDQSFVRKLGSPDGTDAIVRAMLDLARALGLGVTAEGVETAAQWAWLVAAGCHEFQGYLFSKPLTAEELADFHANAARRPAGPDLDHGKAVAG